MKASITLTEEHVRRLVKAGVVSVRLKPDTTELEIVLDPKTKLFAQFVELCDMAKSGQRR